MIIWLSENVILLIQNIFYLHQQNIGIFFSFIALTFPLKSNLEDSSLRGFSIIKAAVCHCGANDFKYFLIHNKRQFHESSYLI